MPLQVPDWSKMSNIQEIHKIDALLLWKIKANDTLNLTKRIFYGGKISGICFVLYNQKQLLLTWMKIRSLILSDPSISSLFFEKENNYSHYPLSYLTHISFKTNSWRYNIKLSVTVSSAHSWSSSHSNTVIVIIVYLEMAYCLKG